MIISVLIRITNSTFDFSPLDGFWINIDTDKYMVHMLKELVIDLLF